MYLYITTLPFTSLSATSGKKRKIMLGSLCHLFLFLHFQLILSSSSFNLSSTPSANKLCSPQQSFALLHFKNNNFPDIICLEYSYPKMYSWEEDTDCCSWDGVTCDSVTGHVIGLDLSSSCLFGPIHDNSSLFQLHHLRELNLAWNGFESNLSSKIGQFKELTHLNLSFIFGGLIPNEIFHLSNLVLLDLSSSVKELSGDSFNKMLQNLTKLRYLHLDYVNMSSVAPAVVANLSSSLTSLSLRSTHLEGKFPNDIFHLPFLQRLSLSDNGGLTGNLPNSNWSGSLRFLELDLTSFSGELSETIGTLKYLKVLDLHFSNFSGSIPASLGNLTEIIHLDLSANNFTGKVPTSISKLSEFTSLNLNYNSFSGPFPDVFGNFSKLTHLILHENEFRGRLPSSAFNLPQLSELDFSYNQFDGPIPNSMFNLVNITELDLSSNNLSGILKSDIFSKFKILRRIDLSRNSLLSLTPYSNTNFTLPNLQEFRFSSCNLTKVPHFLMNSNNLRHLDLSNNRISGRISVCEFQGWRNFSYLNLSYNFLTSFEQIPSTSMPLYIDLRSNLLQGPLFDLPTESILFFLVANNKLTGEIPSSFCNLRDIAFLSLSNNSLTGTIPQCLGNSFSLEFLDLQMNNFHGRIPQSFAEGGLEYLSLQGNQLEGPLPHFLNSSALRFLDVGNNKINDTFPHWLASLPHWLASLTNLQVLILRSNRFHGPINISALGFPFPQLQILDLSHNQFTGFLPRRYFGNFAQGPYGNYGVDYKYFAFRYPNSDGLYFSPDAFQYYSIILVMKGVQRDIDRVSTILTAIDLSDNQFEGGIPGSVLGKFNSLVVLNLSHNMLTDHIPSSLENLTELESLDLSSNKLLGGIPKQLASLTFLSVLNLSNNQLVGPIPQGKQFNTFQNDSFIGNLELCGLPLSKKCGYDKEHEHEMGPTTLYEEDNISSWFDWKVALMGYGCGLVIGLSMGYIVFTIRRPLWFVRMVERKQLAKARRLRGRQTGRRNW